MTARWRLLGRRGKVPLCARWSTVAKPLCATWLLCDCSTTCRRDARLMLSSLPSRKRRPAQILHYCSQTQNVPTKQPPTTQDQRTQRILVPYLISPPVYKMYYQRLLRPKAVKSTITPISTYCISDPSFLIQLIWSYSTSLEENCFFIGSNTKLRGEQWKPR